jgi:GNAT superfamily N-acetyltransferase
VDWTIHVARPDQAGEVLTVQRAAYVSEAQAYDNPHLSALTETLADVAAAIEAGQVLVALAGQRVVGAVRGVRDGAVCQVTRLVVAPDQQGRGLGGALVRAVEAANPTAARFALHTGERSAANLALYAKLGYAEVRREQVADTLALVHLEKPVTVG